MNNKTHSTEHTKLIYNPGHLLKLKKNEILNHFKTKFSLQFYKAIKSAEKDIWEGKDNNYEFLENIIDILQAELETINTSLQEEVGIWNSLENFNKRENANSPTISIEKKQKIPENKPENKIEPIERVKHQPPANSAKEEEEEFSFLDEF